MLASSGICIETTLDLGLQFTILTFQHETTSIGRGATPYVKIGYIKISQVTLEVAGVLSPGPPRGLRPCRVADPFHFLLVADFTQCNHSVTPQVIRSLPVIPHSRLSPRNRSRHGAVDGTAGKSMQDRARTGPGRDKRAFSRTPTDSREGRTATDAAGESWAETADRDRGARRF